MGNEHEGAPDGAVPDDGDVIQPAGNQPAGDQVTDEALAALIDEQSAADQAAESDQAGLSPDQISEEAVVALIAERDDFLDQLQRAKAEFAMHVDAATNVRNCSGHRLRPAWSSGSFRFSTVAKPHLVKASRRSVP